MTPHTVAWEEARAVAQAAQALHGEAEDDAQRQAADAFHRIAVEDRTEAEQVAVLHTAIGRKDLDAAHDIARAYAQCASARGQAVAEARWQARAETIEIARSGIAGAEG